MPLGRRLAVKSCKWGRLGFAVSMSVGGPMRNMHQAVRVLLACAAVIGLLAGNLTAQAGGGAQGVSPASQQRAARLQKERDNVGLQTAVPPFKVVRRTDGRTRPGGRSRQAERDARTRVRERPPE